MRLTIDLPDEPLLALEARTAHEGITFRELILGLLDRGFQGSPGPRSSAIRRSAPPIAIPPSGVPIRAVTREELRRLEEDEDLHAESV